MKSVVIAMLVLTATLAGCVDLTAPPGLHGCDGGSCAANEGGLPMADGPAVLPGSDVSGAMDRPGAVTPDAADRDTSGAAFVDGISRPIDGSSLDGRVLDGDVSSDASTPDAAKPDAAPASTPDSSLDVPPDLPADLPPLNIGAACTAAASCASGLCVDGVCCDSVCAAGCQACNVTGSVGTCAPLAAGTDPDNECDVDPTSTCARDGTCDGANGCRLHAAGTLCAPGACVVVTESSVRTCDGLGTCRPATAKPCAPYVCGQGACATSCTTAAQCEASSFCSGGKCSGLLPLGASCGGAGQCASSVCVDGVCCNSACSGTCQACNLTGSVGTCAPVPDNQDPQAECPTDAASTCGRDGVCNGMGACRLWAAGTQCAAQACASAIQRTARTCNGLGACSAAATTACLPFACAGTVCGTSCTGNSNCASGFICFGGGCIPATGGYLVGRFDAPATSNNLTQLGNADWVQWGHDVPASNVNRKATPIGGLQRISMTFIGATISYRYSDRPVRFSWTDGAPTATVTDTPWGIYVEGLNNGFQFVGDGNATIIRTIKLWVGAWQSRVKIVAHLSDNSAAPYTDNSLDVGMPGQDRVYTFSYRTRDAVQTLIIDWTIEALSSPVGNITIQAATVSQ